MHDCVWIGIDNSKSRSIKLTWLGPEAHKDPWPGDMRSFHQLSELKDYWQSDIESQGTVFIVASSPNIQDPLGALAWLEKKGITSDQFNLDQVAWAFHREVQTYHIPEPYRQSYFLAISALHRDRAWQFAQKAADRMHDAQNQLVQLQHSLRQLVATLPGDSRFKACPF